MDPKTSAFKHLFDFTPAVILAKYLGIDVAESPSEKDWELWNSFSLIPPEKLGELTLNCGKKIVLKHPISAAEKELKALKELICNEDKETIRQLLKELREVELELRDEVLGGNVSIDEVWNGLPALLKRRYEEKGLTEEIAEELVHLPADPAFPDHDWLSRAEFYATIRAIEEAGEKPYLLRFKISPVQSFIGNARKERDFWAGSHLLSALTYIAIEEIMKETWPWAVIFPHLRGQPVFEKGFKQADDDLKKKLKIPNMPNKVLAIIGLREGEQVKDKERELENEIRREIGTYLNNLFKEAWEHYEMDKLVERLGLDPAEEKKKAKETLENYFYITVALWPYKGDTEVFDENMKEFFERASQYNHNKAYIQYPYLFAVLDQKTEFKSNEWEKAELPDGFKCTVCGELPAIGQYSCGKPGYRELRKAWRDHVRDNLHKNDIHDIREDEMLCPLCLVKRWYGKKENYKIESVSEIAIMKVKGLRELYEIVADKEKCFKTLSSNGEQDEVKREFIQVFGKLFHGGICDPAGALQAKGLGANSEVLYLENLSSEKALAKVYGIDEKTVRDELNKLKLTLEDVRSTIEKLSKTFREPPKYYAMLKMDGDNMGKVISGEKGMREVKEYLHLEIGENKSGGIFSEKRPVNPPVHVAITRSLSTFAVEKVPKIVRDENKGELILAGGDDVLALLPTDTVINAAYKLQETFRMDWDDEKKFDYLQGKTRSMSAGLLVAYYKEPLYHVYDLASGLEHLAKESGRNAMAIGYLTHSGNFYRVVANWDVFSANSPLWRLLRRIVEEGEKSSEDFTISSRFIYELFEDVENWPNDPEAIEKLLRFEIGRHVSVKDKDKKRKIHENVLKDILWIASHIRVKVNTDDYVTGNNSEKKLTGKKVEEYIMELLTINPEEENKNLEKEKESEKRKSSKFWEDIKSELSERLGNLIASPRELAGEIMKKQLRDTAMLIRILRKMSAEEVSS